MWFGFMWWWIIPLVFFLMLRDRGQRRWRRREAWNGDGQNVAELRQVVEKQRGYIEDLESRLTRVEDGLEFAERLLAERGAAPQPS